MPTLTLRIEAATKAVILNPSLHSRINTAKNLHLAFVILSAAKNLNTPER
jgi:hypothetical protein